MFYTPVRIGILLCALTAGFAQPALAQHRMCDPGAEDCRQILIDHIRAEKVGLDVAFWFMEDSWIAQEVINKWKAGVPVRVLMDSEANLTTPRNITRLNDMKAAGIPMRERVASGILHWKMMLFAGQGIVEFSGANYSSDAWLPSSTTPYANYVDESILFTSEAAIVNSFRTKYDDLWTNTTQYANYANINGALWRVYGTFPIDPRLNFVPAESHADRAIPEFGRETAAIDVIMYRITDSRFSDAMIAAKQRGVSVRLITEPAQYRDVNRLWHSWNVDRMYMAGIPIKQRAHAGLNHQKSVLLRSRREAIFGSSNWSNASADSQEEHNIFTQDPFIYDWMVAQFERKWNNTGGVVENQPFVPLPPDQPTQPSPAYQATSVPTSGLTLSWYGGPWAHYYDVYLGTSSGDLQLVGANLSLGPSQSTSQMQSFAVPGALSPGTTYYWRVAGKTVANQSSLSPIWTFTTSGTTPPPAPTVTLVRQPYLQQVTSTSAVVVWATRESGTAQVRYGAPGGTTTTVAASSTLFPASTTALPSDYYQHVARITGLTPSTTYQYDILVSAIDLNPQVDTLTTAPARGSGSVTFIAFGDSGTGSAAQQQLAARLDAETFDFALHGGDIAYGSADGTGGATYRTMDDWFFSMYRNWLRKRPMFPSIGNHDSRATNADGRPYRDLFVLPEQGGSGAFADHAERYYSFDYGPVHVIVLDTELAFQGPDLSRRNAQLAWADADLAGTSQPWKIAVFHRSPYSAGGEHGSDLEVRNAFGPLFDAHGVQLVVSAHEHDYERTLAMRAGTPDASGTVYIVSGGGGGPLYASGTAAWTAFSASAYHYLKGTAGDCTLRVDAVRPDGTTLDTVSLNRCVPAPDTQPPSAAVASPANGATVSGTVTVTASASDNVGVTAVTLTVDGIDLATDTSAPYSFTWTTTAVANGTHTLRVRAADAAGNTTTSAAVTVTVANGTASAGDIVLYASEAQTLVGNWIRQDDATAAGGRLLRNPDRGAAKRTTALAAPVDYAELTFTPQVNVPYRLWMRGKADGDLFNNDSVFVQFSGANGYAIGTTAAAEYNLEDCSGCGVSGWGWQDNGWGVGVMGPTITFTTAGIQTMRIQVREDGLSLDQIMLSPSTYLNASPGALKNDTKIYPRSSGGTTPPADTEAPATSIASPAAGATVSGTVTVSAAASDNTGVTRVDFYLDGAVAASDSSAPYQFSWSTTASANGSHTLQSRAFDAAGNTGVSAVVSVTVNNTVTPPPNANPTVTLTSPAHGSTYTAPATIALAANASDSDGTIARVEFYSGGTLIGTSTASPYQATWSGVAAGTYVITARATDNVGATTTSTGATVTVTAPPPPPSLPAPWTSQDIGAVGPAGSATASSGTFTVKGGGADIWNNADAFHYVWQRISGDVDVVARVTSVEYVQAWVKAGVMIRERLTADSAHGLMLVSPGKGLAFQRRVSNGGLSTNTSGGAGTAPAWVKVSRRGNTITAYLSADGTTWTTVGSDTFSMPADVYAGLVVSSHDATRLATATFDNVAVTPVSAPPPPNVPPAVNITTPVNDARFTAPATIGIAASAQDSDGSVTRVDFYAGATLLGSSTAAPYQVTWSNVPAGAYSLTARAFDNSGAATVSSPVSIVVEAPPPPSGLPSPWSSQDIGAVGPAGSATASGGVFTVKGAGADIWNSADAFHYVWQPLSGDADVVARVTSIEYVQNWVKAGVMIRERLTADSAHGLMLVSPGKGLAFQRRVATAGSSTSTSGGSGTAPAWVKLERRGNTITAYRSADGVAWTLVGSDTFTMGPNVYVGLAVSSHTSTQLATATFDNVTVTRR